MIFCFLDFENWAYYYKFINLKKFAFVSKLKTVIEISKESKHKFKKNMKLKTKLLSNRLVCNKIVTFLLCNHLV